VLIEGLGNGAARGVSGREEVRLAAHEAEQVVEETVDALALLDGCHKQAVKFLLFSTHIFL
jgi:hypothetical protein